VLRAFAVLNEAAMPFSVLFLCTGNSARSILAEAYLNSAGRGRFRAYSAGSHPTGKVNPFALELLAHSGIDTYGLHSKGWEEFALPGAPAMNFVFTVCDSAAGEPCPVWPSQPMTAHWGVDDPARIDGTNEDKRRGFKRTLFHLSARIHLFMSLPIHKLDRLALQEKLDEIGKAGTELNAR
jgi:protein-tyrosine-phosphatase